jgi:hypothetical protein
MTTTGLRHTYPRLITGILNAIGFIYKFKNILHRPFFWSRFTH